MHLMRPGTTLSTALVNDPKTEAHEITAGGVTGELHIKSRPSTPPWWVPYLDPLVDAELTAVPSGGAMSAVVLLDLGDDLVAFSFGQGRHLLAPARIETDFGLRTALNLLDPSRLKSLDKRQFEEVALLSRQQVSRSMGLSAFDVNTVRDVLTAVVGEPHDQALGKRIVGRDSLVLNLTATATELADVAADLLEAYRLDHYLEAFGWIDDVRRVRDPTVIAVLDDALSVAADALADGTAQPLLYLAAPEIINWDDVDSFRYSNQGKKDVRTFPDIELEDWLAIKTKSKKRTVDRMKDSYVEMMRASTSTSANVGTVYSCVVHETDLGGTRHVLLAGDWYAISEDFVAQTDAKLSLLKLSPISFPGIKADERENEYLMRVSPTLTDAVVLDGKSIVHGGGHSSIELCDVLLADGTFIHAKKRGRSSVLSHLWNQGVVAANTFKLDDGFRMKARELVDGMHEHLFDAAPTQDQFEITYLLLGADPHDPCASLPFFSKVALTSAMESLRLAGYRMSVAAAATES